MPSNPFVDDAARDDEEEEEEEEEEEDGGALVEEQENLASRIGEGGKFFNLTICAISL